MLWGFKQTFASSALMMGQPFGSKEFDLFSGSRAKP